MKMLSYAECKEIAIKKAEDYNSTVDTAYKLGEDYVFSNSRESVIGILPVVVSTETGACKGLWPYLIDTDFTMDDMQEIEF